MMTKMKKQKSGRCKFFQSLASAFSRKKKRGLDDEPGIPQPPFATDDRQQPVDVIKELSKSAASPTGKHKPVAKLPPNAQKKPTAKASQSSVSDLDVVPRDIGMMNNNFAKDKLRIRQTQKRVPARYDVKPAPGTDPLDLISEDAVTVHAEDDELEKSSLVRDQRAKGSVTPVSGTQTNDSGIIETELSSNSDSNEKISGIVVIPKKQNSGKTESTSESSSRDFGARKKSGNNLPRTSETDYATDGSTDGMWGAGSASGSGNDFNQHASNESLPGEKVKITVSSSLEAEAKNSDLGDSKDLDSSAATSQPTGGPRKLKRIFLDVAENESGDLAPEPLAAGSVFRRPSDQKKTSSNEDGSKAAAEVEPKGSVLKTSKVTRAESAVVKNDAKEKTNLKRASTRIKSSSKEITAENVIKAGKSRESTRKRKDEKVEKGGLSEASTGNVAVKEEERPAESVKKIENVWVDVNQNESLASSTTVHSRDPSVVSNDGNTQPEKIGDSELKNSNPVAVVPTIVVPEVVKNASRKGREVKAAEAKRQSVGDSNASEFSKAFEKVRNKPSSDVTNDVAPESHDEKSGGKAENKQSTSLDRDASKAGNEKLSGIKRVESQKKSKAELLSSKGNLASHSRDSSVVSDEGKAGSASLESEKKSVDSKIAPPSSPTGESAGKTSFKGSFPKVIPKQPVAKVASDSSSVALVDGVVLSSTENVSSGDGSLKTNKAVSSLKSESRIDALGRSFGGSKRGKIGDSKSGEDQNVPGDTRKPTLVVAETDKIPCDGNVVGYSMNKGKPLPTAPATKRTGKVQPKLAENEKEAAWVSKARRLSKDYGDKALLSAEATNEKRKSGIEVEGSENLERGVERASVRERVKKIQQTNNTG